MQAYRHVHYIHVQSHPEDRGDFGQGSTNHISEYTFWLELSICGMCCSYHGLANPNMKLRIQFIIMKIFMKIVKICPKSPRFTVVTLERLSFWNMENFQHYQYSRLPLTLGIFKECFIPDMTYILLQIGCHSFHSQSFCYVTFTVK